MRLTVTHCTQGGEAFLLDDNAGQVFLFDRTSRTVSVVDQTARLARRASWETFEGDPEPIIEAVGAILRPESGM